MPDPERPTDLANGLPDTPAPSPTQAEDNAPLLVSHNMASRLYTPAPAIAQSDGGPTCPFCASQDSMEPFRRRSRIFLLSRLFPRLRWRYCRSCTRHFIAFRPRSRKA